MKKPFSNVILLLSILSLSLSACGTSDASSNYDDDERYNIYLYAVADGYNGTYEEWLLSIKGKDGQDGHTPVITIGDDGKWYIDGVNTNVTARGEKGDQGEPGSNGQDGAPGQNGDDGSSVLTGSGVPDNGLGKDGDAYINTDTWDYYGKSNGTWSVLGNIKGQQGNDGVSVVSIVKTYTTGLVDTYSITYSDNHTSTFTVTNGEEGPQGIQGNPGDDGHTPVITINGDGYWVVDGVPTSTFARGPQGNPGEDGISIVSIVKTGNVGLIDTYTITYSDNHTSTFTVTNGEEGPQGIQGNPGDDGHTPVITINSSGNWVVDNVDTGFSARGPKGEKGDTGAQGNEGKSAYVLYCENHPEYTKSEEEWLDDLVNGRLANKESHTVTFNSNGGSSVESQHIMHGEKATKPNNPAKDGYSFVNWIDNNGDNWVFNGYSITSDITLNAVWSANEYTISLDANGGSTSTNSINVRYNEEFELPTAFREGYNFLGWFDNQETKWESGTYQVADNTSLCASWDVINYTISYILNGGTNNVNNPAGYNYDSDSITLLNPSRSGYNFEGWYTTPTFEPESQVLTIPQHSLGNKVLYAKWSIINYSITYNLDQGTNSDQNPNQYTVEQEIVFQNPTKTGFDFGGWYDNPDFNGDAITTIPVGSHQNIVLYAKWLLGGDYSNLKYTINDFDITIKGVYDNTVNDIKVPYTLTFGDNTYTVTSIEDGAFSNCNNISSITLPFVGGTSSSNQYLGYIFGAPSYYSNNNYVPTSLVKVTLQEGCDSISANAFYGCANLTSIDLPNSIASIGNNAFANCSSITDIDVHASSIENFLNVQGKYSLVGTVHLIDGDGDEITEVVIPDTVTSVDSYEFKNCSNITSIYVPDTVTSIGQNAFSGCTSMVSLTIPNSYEIYSIFGQSIPSSLNEVELLEGCTSISDYSFRYCSHITTISIPDSVTSISTNAFKYCTSLQYNEYENGKYLGNSGNSYAALISIIDTDTSVTSFSIHKDCQCIVPYIFKDCTSLTSITVPFIGAYKGSNQTFGIIFGTSENPNYNASVPASLTEVVILEDCTYIPSNAFRNCSHITTISIPNSIVRIDPSAFIGCSSLTYSVFDNAKYLGNNDNPYLVLYSVIDTSITSCTINNNCKCILDYAFANCINLTSLTVPEGVVFIGNYAFANNTGDSYSFTITLPSTIQYIGSNAFENNTYAVTYIKVSSIEDFLNISGKASLSRFVHLIDMDGIEITDIVVPNTVTSIDSYEFYGCVGITSITLPDTITTIGNYAFYNCESLTSINIPEGVVSIGNYAFRCCSNLTTVNISDGLISIGNYAFADCTNLASINITSTVTSIGAYAFIVCTHLTSIVIPISVTEIGTYAFAQCSALTINCEAESKPSGWNANFNPSNRPVNYGYIID